VPELSRLVRRNTLLLAATLAVLGLASGAQGLAPEVHSTLTVAPRGSNECPRADFRSIQEAIDAAKPGDTVSVCVLRSRDAATAEQARPAS